MSPPEPLPAPSASPSRALAPVLATTDSQGTGGVARRARRDRLALRIALAVLVVSSLAILTPFVPWLTLAAWFATLARPALAHVARLLGGRRRGAALLTLGLFVVVLGPISLVAVVVALDAVALWQSILASGSADGALRALVADGATDPLDLRVPDLTELVQTHVAEALGLASGIAGFAADMAVGLFVFFSASFVFLTEGPRAFEWAERNTPIATRHLERFAAAFEETGRGLLVSVGMSGAVQALLATIVYVGLGVAHALVLGLVTFFAALIPSIGTALVWVPVSIGLFLSGRSTAAIVLVVLGVFLISTSDNLLRPLFARWGKLDLHPLLVLLAMLGGLVVVGPWGLLLGPVVVRFAIEALRIARDERTLE